MSSGMNQLDLKDAMPGVFDAQLRPSRSYVNRLRESAPVTKFAQ